MVLVGAAVIVLVVAVIGITAIFARPSMPPASTPVVTPASTPAAGPSTPTPTTTPTPTAPPAATGAIAIASITTYDPSGGHEHEEWAARLWDGDPATAWSTFTYTQPKFGQLKDGVGLIVTLKQPAKVSSVTIYTPHSGGKIEIRATDPTDRAGGKVLASGPAASPSKTFTFSSPQTTDSFVIWLDDLPQSADGYVLKISEIEVG